VSSPPSAPDTDSVTAEVHGDRATLVLRRFLRHPPARVWEALTDPEQVRQWYLTTARSDQRAGGRVEMTTELSGVHATGRILAWDPPRVYEYEWNVTDSAIRLFRAERTVVRWELTPLRDGTLLVLTHRDLSKTTAAVFQVGLPFLLDRLSAQLDGRPFPPDWEERVREGARRALTQGDPGGAQPP